MSSASMSKPASIIMIADVPPEKGRGHYSYAEVVRQCLSAKGAAVAVVSTAANHLGFRFGGPPSDYFDFSADDQAFHRFLKQRDPDVVVFDTFPFWMFEQERYKKIIDQYTGKDNANRRPRYVTILRDIWSWRDEAQTSIRRSLPDFSAVVIRGNGGKHEDPRIMEEIQLSGVTRMHCGYIVDPWLYTYERMTSPGVQERLVVVHQGGALPVPAFPEKADQIQNFFLASMLSKGRLGSAMAAVREAKWKVYVNPLYDAGMLADLIRMGHGTDVTVETLPQKQRYLQEMVNAEAVIVRGGYNTTLELMTTRVPRVMLPYFEKDGEQAMRSQMLFEQNRGFTVINAEHGVRPSEMTREDFLTQLSTLIGEKLTEAYGTRFSIPVPDKGEFDGGDRAADILLQLARSS